MARKSKWSAWVAAGLVMTGLFAALFLFVTRSARAPSVNRTTAPIAQLEPAPAAPTSESAAASPGVSPEDVAPPELLATADELEAQYESRKGEMPEDLAEPLDEEIGVIEGAVANLLAAIAAEPENESLKRMLVATYRNEVRLLRKALHLSTDTEEVDETLE